MDESEMCCAQVHKNNNNKITKTNSSEFYVRLVEICFFSMKFVRKCNVEICQKYKIDESERCCVQVHKNNNNKITKTNSSAFYVRLVEICFFFMKFVRKCNVEIYEKANGTVPVSFLSMKIVCREKECTCDGTINNNGV